MVGNKSNKYVTALHSVIFLPARPASQTHDSRKGRMIIFKSDTPPTFLPLSLSNTFEGQGYCGWGVNRTGQRLKTTPARFFFRCGLFF